MAIDKYRAIITPTFLNDINQIYEYIKNNLYADRAAKRLMNKIEKEVQRLNYAPKIHNQIEKQDELKRTYRRIVIENYVILYTIDEENMIIYVSHMYYGGSDYFNKV